MRVDLFSRYIHRSWLIATASIGVLLGTWWSLQTTAFASTEWLVVGVCLLVVGMFRSQRGRLIMVLCAGSILGLWRGGDAVLSQQIYERFIGQEVVVVGRVADDVTYDVEGDVRFVLDDVRSGDQELPGKLWVGTQRDSGLQRSDVVVVRGQMSEGFGTIPAALYRADVQLIAGAGADVDPARVTRDWFADGIREGIREPEASLASGFLLGQQSNLPEKLDNELRLLGLTHIVVASGYNLSILVRFARKALSRVSRFTALAGSGLLVYGFANITGFSPSMTRAGLITGLSLLAWYYGRKYHPIVLLSFSAAITVLVTPSYAWGDIGWLLSFSAFVGVIMLSPLLHAYFWGNGRPGTIRQIWIETLAAQIVTAPIILYVFAQYSPLALIANILVLPLIPFAMLLTFIGGLWAVALPFGSTIIAWPAEILLGYMTAVVDWLARQPVAQSDMSLGATGVIVAYMLLGVGMVHMWRRTGYQFRDYNIVE